MSTKVQLVGGAFQDAEGNVLENGYLELILNQDNAVVGSGNITAGVTLRVQLDSDGNAASSTSTPPATNQFIWGTDVMVVPNAYYRVTGYTANGQPAWGPNNQQIIGSGTFNLGTWIPNKIFSWQPPVSALLLETNGTPNEVQSILDLESGNNITLTDNGDGSVTIDAAQGGWILKINGSNEAPTPHSTVNFQQGNGVSFSDNGSGLVSFGLTGFQTTDLGFIYGGQDFMPIADDSGGFWDVTGNEVFAVQLFLKVPQKVNRISAYVITGSAGAFTAGIYDATGTTKIIDAGAAAFSLGGSQRFVTTASFTGQGTTLQAGTYWFAFGAPSTANGSVICHELGMWVRNLINGLDLSNPQTTPTRFGKAANALSAGALPSTLGAITAIDHTESSRIPAVIFAA